MNSMIRFERTIKQTTRSNNSCYTITTNKTPNYESCYTSDLNGSVFCICRNQLDLPVMEETCIWSRMHSWPTQHLGSESMQSEQLQKSKNLQCNQGHFPFNQKIWFECPEMSIGGWDRIFWTFYKRGQHQKVCGQISRNFLLEISVALLH